MNKIITQCQKIKQQKRLGLMTHVVAGYPTLTKTRELVLAMAQEGVDFIELQIPFSDPLGDGPTIRKANTAALEHGLKVRQVFSLARKLTHKDGVSIPLFFMTYFNIVFAYGLKKFCQDAKAAGISGLIIPDYNLSLEGTEHFNRLASNNNLILIRFAGLESQPKRLTKLSAGAKGFVYCFSSQGVTGVRAKLNPHLKTHLQKLCKYFKLPLAVGFGISGGEQVRLLRGHANIVVVGSAILNAYQKNGLAGARKKIRELIKALK